MFIHFAGSFYKFDGIVYPAAQSLSALQKLGKFVKKLWLTSDGGEVTIPSYRLTQQDSFRLFMKEFESALLSLEPHRFNFKKIVDEMHHVYLQLRNQFNIHHNKLDEEVCFPLAKVSICIASW